MNEILAEIKSKGKEVEVLDPVAILEVIELLESAATKDAPYFFEYLEPDGSTSREKITREEHLDFYIEYAVETIYELIDIEE